jgi:hypothetical protein
MRPALPDLPRHGALLLAGILAVLAGCGAALRPAVKVAVLPVETLGGSDGAALRSAIDAAFTRDLPGAAAGAGAVDAAVAAEAPAPRPASQPAAPDAPAAAPAASCAADSACPRRVGRRLGTGHVLAVTVASLARTHVLRARLISTDETIAEREVSETIVGGQDALATAVGRLPSRLFPPPPPRWYARWWVWAGAAAVAAAVTTAAVVLTRGGGQHADAHVPLP